MKGMSMDRWSVTPRMMLSVSVVLFIALTGGTIFLSSYVKAKMTGIYLHSVQTLFNSFQEGVRDSLERGQMKNFEKLLGRQEKIEGVLDVSLYDRHGRINLSSSGAEQIGKGLEPGLERRLAAGDGIVRVAAADRILFLAPQVVEADCIRCHPSWQEGEHGGIISLTYDLSELNRTLTELQRLLLAGTILLLLITGGMIHLVMRRIVSRPIDAVIGKLARSSAQIDLVAGKAATAGQSLAENASNQAASLEQTSASLMEISTMIASNADNAFSASSLTAEADQVMTDANRRMENLTRSMAGISQANEEAGNIIRNIDEIAFQTNLLALNAAVEAARAGEAGVGFAVVADEVRNLAQRAARAARDTTELLEGTRNRVNSGMEMVKLTGEAFVAALEKSTRAAGLLKEIAAASKEQSQGVEQVTRAMTELDKVTQQNAADADQAARIAQEMEEQSHRLNENVATMVKIVRGADDDHHGSAPPRRPPRF
jgi:methyl-accepting chemotaxis protein